MSRVVVAGAGIAGLTVAASLGPEHEVRVFEREAHAGGKIRSEHVDGFLFEWGPNGVLSNAAELRELIGELGLDDAFAPAAAAARKRWVYWGGALHALPAGPPGALKMSLLSTRGKLRALGDLFVRARADAHDEAGDDESVFAFAARHFGREVAERIVAPALLGVSGGDAATTSAAAVFPRLIELERAGGSVIRGMARARGPRGRLSGFGADGMQRLTDRLAERAGGRLALGDPVERLERSAACWQVGTARGEATADAVVLAVPANAAATLVAPFDAELARLLGEIPYAPMRVVGAAFAASDVPGGLDGLGFLAARGQGVRSLGVLYTSEIFPAQAPPGSAYLRIFLGGAGDPAAVALDTESVRAIVRADLAKTLGITAAPMAWHEVTWPHAIPQYGLRHRALVRAIDERVAQHPGLTLTGNAYRGLSVADTVREARVVAAELNATA